MSRSRYLQLRLGAPSPTRGSSAVRRDTTRKPIDHSPECEPPVRPCTLATRRSATPSGDTTRPVVGRSPACLPRRVGSRVARHVLLRSGNGRSRSRATDCFVECRIHRRQNSVVQSRKFLVLQTHVHSSGTGFRGVSAANQTWCASRAPPTPGAVLPLARPYSACPNNPNHGSRTRSKAAGPRETRTIATMPKRQTRDGLRLNARRTVDSAFQCSQSSPQYLVDNCHRLRRCLGNAYNGTRRPRSLFIHLPPPRPRPHVCLVLP